MLHLMKLEMKKFKLMKTYIPKLMITMTIVVGMSILMMYATYDDTENVIESAKDFYLINQVLGRMVWLIFSSVVLADITVEEYRKKTILRLFTYPVSRKKVFIAKLAIVFLFTIAIVIVNETILNLIIFLVSSQTGWIPNDVTFLEVLARIPDTIVGALFCGIISLIPFVAAMHKKSVAATILAAVILVTIMSSNFGADVSEQQYFLRMVIVGVVGVVSILYSFHFQLNSLEECDL